MLASVLQSSHEDNNSSSDTQDEILRSARANVGLIADGIWAPSGQDETYRKLNRALWIRSNQIAARYAELDSEQQQRRETRSRVRDVIPDSRLAIYGDFEYENEPPQEDLKEEKRRRDESPEMTNGESKGREKESWMLDEVEEFVAWAEEASKRSRRRCRSLSKPSGALKSSRKAEERRAKEKSTTQNISEPVQLAKLISKEEAARTPLQQQQLRAAKFRPSPSGETSNSYSDESTAPPRFSVTNVSEAQLEGRIFNEAVRSLWRTSSAALNSSPSTRTLRQCQRELGMLRPQVTTTTTTTTTATARRLSEVQLTHSSFQNERLRLPSSRCQYSYMHRTLNIVQQQRVNSPVTAPLPPLCVDVPEFFPKGPNTWPCLEDQQQQAKPIHFYAVPTMASESTAYQDEMFPYKGHVAGRKAVALYQNQVVPMVPTPLVSALVWPPNWAQQRLLAPGPIHIQQLPAAASLPPNCSMMPPTPAPQAQPAAPAVVCPTVVHRAIKIHESTISQPSPIPVYQRPHQQQQSGKSGQEYSQRKKSQGVDFSNLILLTKSAMKVRRNQGKAAKKAFSETTGKGQSSAKAEGYSTRWLDKGCQPKRERELVTVSTVPRLPITRSEDLACSTNSGSGSRRTSQSADDELTEASRKRLYRDVLESSTASPPSRDDDEDDVRFEKRYDELERQAMEQYRTSEECLAQRYQELEQQALEQYRNAESSESLEQESLLHARSTAGNSNDEETRDHGSSSGFGKYSRSSKKTSEVADDGNGKVLAKPSPLSTLKRRLIPMSPLDRKKSGTDLMKNASLDPMKAVQKLDKHVAAYYRNTKVIPTGSGDDRINNTGGLFGYLTFGASPRRWGQDCGKF
ncbi:hypothetical protein TSAR_012969 [Trichomalopsis sarcophagae]|uniref:Uncharacterized protein n=1 Tax=Trichomalopsis sarcophagae TaxID=543379 RepID=A0A232EPC2_9HYME|nr:hypothetical protein TSAR_012969 [Trichomalopsis sarcophagae]